MEQQATHSSSQSNMINGTSQQWYLMAKRKVGRPKPSHNSMGVHGSEPDKCDCELKTSGVANCNTMTNPPPTGGGSEAGAQESPSMRNIKLEYNIVLPDKGKGLLMQKMS